MENIELKENELIVSPNGKFGYQINPLTDIKIIVNREDLQAIRNKTKCFDLENNCVVDYDNTEDLKIQHLQDLRAKRVPLLKAFDVYKSNVNYGVEFETEEQREEIIKWYGNLLHLEESALDIIPERIRYYL